MYYIPVDFDEYTCVEYLVDRIRVYDHYSEYDLSFNYTDYYLDYHYNSISGITDVMPTTCLDQSLLTSSSFYRNDISDISITFFCIFFINMAIIVFLLKSLFKGRIL